MDVGETQEANSDQIHAPNAHPISVESATRGSRGRKRGRMATACTQCHSRKQKCNNQQPCLNCIHRGVSSLCIFLSSSDSARKPQKRKLPAQQIDISQASPIAASGGETDDPTSVHDDDYEPSPSVGSLWKSRGAPTFYGTSYFGGQVAATMIGAKPPDYEFGFHTPRSSAAQPFRNEGAPFSELWDLLGLLPRQKSTVDRLTDKFLTELNWSIDAVHPTTFRANYDKFWDRKYGFDDIGTVDLRWLALLFIIIAFGELLDCPQPCSPERQRDCENSSNQFYWASRRAIVIAPSFFGESSDLVRAGLLCTRYLIHKRRFSESWLTIGFASRIAMAQGIHVDGTRWGLPRKAVETRRRIFSHLYTLDRMISLALGRPYAISDQHCLTREVSNIWVDEMTNSEAVIAQPQPLDDPTPSVLSIFNHTLGKIIGRIQEQCFGLDPPLYDKVLSLDRELIAWKNELPGYFRLERPDLSLDNIHSFLKWHRLYLHTNYHFARITLHRPYLLRSSITNRFQHSWDACIDSACTDLRVRLGIDTTDLIEKFKWSLGAHQLFNSALVLGIIAIRTPHTQESQAIIEDLEAYCQKENADLWMNEFGLAELKVVELCIEQAKKRRGQRPIPTDSQRSQYKQAIPLEELVSQRSVVQPNEEQPTREPPAQGNRETESFTPHQEEVLYSDPSNPNSWSDQFNVFPEAGDFRTWQQMINSMPSDF